MYDATKNFSQFAWYHEKKSSVKVEKSLLFHTYETHSAKHHCFCIQWHHLISKKSFNI